MGKDVLSVSIDEEVKKELQNAKEKYRFNLSGVLEDLIEWYLIKRGEGLDHPEIKENWCE
jgi:hypothetical protein